MFSQLFTCVHMNWGEMKLKTVWISYRSFWSKWNFKAAWDFLVNIIYSKWNEQAQTRWMLRLMHMCVWNSMLVRISYETSFWVIKYHVNNACPSKYWVVLKCSRNKDSCKQNLFSLRFETPNRYEFILPLLWRWGLGELSKIPLKGIEQKRREGKQRF